MLRRIFVPASNQCYLSIIVVIIIDARDKLEGIKLIKIAADFLFSLGNEFKMASQVVSMLKDQNENKKLKSVTTTCIIAF